MDDPKNTFIRTLHFGVSMNSGRQAIGNLSLGEQFFFGPRREPLAAPSLSLCFCLGTDDLPHTS